MSTTPYIDRAHTTEQHRMGLYYTTVEVVAVEQLSPRMRRITLGGPGLEGFYMPAVNVAVRLFFPVEGQVLDELPAQEEQPAIIKELRSRARVYTVRRFDAGVCELAIDVALHGNGVASTWAAEAVAGQRLVLSGPRAHPVPQSHSSFLVLAADETALGAIEAILESLPSDEVGHVFVTAADAEEQRTLGGSGSLGVTWIDRSNGESLLESVKAWCKSGVELGEEPAAWLAGEFYETRDLRDYLRVAFDGRDRIESYPYWRRGNDATTLDEARAATFGQAMDKSLDVDKLDDFELVQ